MGSEQSKDVNTRGKVEKRAAPSLTNGAISSASGHSVLA